MIFRCSHLIGRATTRPVGSARNYSAGGSLWDRATWTSRPYRSGTANFCRSRIVRSRESQGWRSKRFEPGATRWATPFSREIWNTDGLMTEARAHLD